MKKDYVIITILAVVLAVVVGLVLYNNNIKPDKEVIYHNHNGIINDINKNEIEQVTINRYNEESDIKKDDKINIYFFLASRLCSL